MKMKMYDELAYLWPLISPPEHYKHEALIWKNILDEKLKGSKGCVLELGVGGGHNLSHLTDSYEATAVDISPKMLINSRRLNPTVTHFVGDMRTVRLNKKFDAVIIHDAISYLLNEKDIEMTIRTVTAHLRPGGIFVTAPDWLKETFPGIHTDSHLTKGIDTEVALFEYSHDPNPLDTTMETYFTYYIKEEGILRIEQDKHITGLFSENIWTSAMSKVGFKVEVRAYPVHDDNRNSKIFIALHKGKPNFRLIAGFE